MPRASSIATLPPEVLEQLQGWLRDPRITQLEATDRTNALLTELGLPERVSKSSVNRYHGSMEAVGARLRQSREVAEMWIGKLGSQPQGEVGKLINEIIRTLTFETSMQIAEGAEPASPKMLAQLALAVQRLESAASMNEEREKKIREAERQRIVEELEAAAESDPARTGGMTREGIATIKREILGIG